MPPKRKCAASGTSNLGRRLKKLEVELTDESGLVPHSTKWRAYWLDWMQKLVNGENPPGKMPIDAFRSVVDDVVVPPDPDDEQRDDVGVMVLDEASEAKPDKKRRGHQDPWQGEDGKTSSRPIPIKTIRCAVVLRRAAASPGTYRQCVLTSGPRPHPRMGVSRQSDHCHTEPSK